MLWRSYSQIVLLAAELQKIFTEMHKRVAQLEEEKYDLEYDVRQKDFEVNFFSYHVVLAVCMICRPIQP